MCLLWEAVRVWDHMLMWIRAFLEHITLLFLTYDILLKCQCYVDTCYGVYSQVVVSIINHNIMASASIATIEVVYHGKQIGLQLCVGLSPNDVQSLLHVRIILSYRSSPISDIHYGVIVLVQSYFRLQAPAQVVGIFSQGEQLVCNHHMCTRYICIAIRAHVDSFL